MDILKRCRVCRTIINGDSYNLWDNPDLAYKYKACSDLNLTEESGEHGVPKCLCQSCFDNVEEFFAFRSLCIESDGYWRSQERNSPGVFVDEKPKYNVEEENPSPSDVEHIEMEGTIAELVDTAVKKPRGRPLKSRKASTDVVTINEDAKSHSKDEGETKVQSSGKRLQTQNTPIFQCDICPTRFFVEHRLVAHKRLHDGLVPYPCTHEGCERGFNRLHCLSEHLKEHAGTSCWYACEQEGCTKTYKHKPTLVMHMRKSHKMGPEPKKHVCEFCGKVFKSSAVLKDHCYTHKDQSELPHACEEPECLRRFSKKEKLKVHMLRHAGIKNFTCPYCGMRKTTRNELKIHINYHTLERTWPCRFCTKVCNSAGNLKMHVRTVHERARDYACSHCDRTFAKPDTRKYHEMTHTGEKPNECLECGKRFTQPAALRTHRKIHQRQREKTNTLSNRKSPCDEDNLA
ncbi:RB-associated KRAB zinc finger protein [Scaptodrosophila lebanonensis]|uniref:RB-associated KRAB zinc finger protein n=1 Tax=Drosophila lebanonensis TaxID=7225 RepID=A0A6J2THJ0_DROLE|nr:RB-associated KRAB zinc finger protein [Scaptodrosophila lebanonensis]